MHFCRKSVFVPMLLGCCITTLATGNSRSKDTDGNMKEAGRLKRFLTHPGGGWNKTRLSYKINNFPHDFSVEQRNDVPIMVTRKQVKMAFKKAFQEWASISPLKFKQSRNKADINIEFKIFDADKPGINRYARAYYPSQGGDIMLDVTDLWTYNDGRVGYDLFQVGVHLIGHSLGLQNSLDPKAVMYPIYKYKKNWKFGRDDIKGIQALYGKK